MKNDFIVDNLKYYSAEESAITGAMKLFEASLLNVAERAVRDAGFEVGSYIKEGYYHETPELMRFFDCIRTLQNNFTHVSTPAIRKLQEIYADPLFGIAPAMATTRNASAYTTDYRELRFATVSTMVDAVTIASDRSGPNWTIDKIMLAVDMKSLGVNLVGLGITVDLSGIETKGMTNPLATCMACEASVLSREPGEAAAMPGEHEVNWRVSPDVEDYGRRVIEGYRALFNRHAEIQVELPYVNPENAERLYEDSPSIFRCVNLNIDHVTGRADPYYHWAIKYTQSGFRVVDFYTNRIVTTQEWQRGMERG